MSKLSRLAAMLSSPFSGAMTGALSAFLPAFQGMMAEYNKPESEGGHLRQGEVLAYFAIAPNGDKANIVVVFFKFENQALTVNRQIVLQTIEE